MCIRTTKWLGTTRFRVWTLFLCRFYCMCCICIIAFHFITMHYLPLSVLQSSSISYCAASDKGWRLQIFAQCTTTRGQNTTPPPPTHVRRTLLKLWWWSLLLIKCTHWRKLVCVCLQTEDIWLGLCQWCDDGCQRGSEEDEEAGLILGGVADFAGWCVLNICCWYCATYSLVVALLLLIMWCLLLNSVI